MAGDKPKKRVKPFALEVPPELARIEALRAKFTGNGQEEQQKELDLWATKVKKAAILLSLEGHEGIQMILDRAEEELQQIDEVLLFGSKPKELSPEGAMRHAMEQYAIYEKKEHWEWFRGLFTEAKRQIKEVRQDLDLQDEEDIAPGA